MACQMIGEPPKRARHATRVHKWRFEHTTDGRACAFVFVPATRGGFGTPMPGSGLLRFTCQTCGEVAIPDTGVRAIKSALKALSSKDTVSLPTRDDDPIVIHRRIDTT